MQNPCAPYTPRKPRLSDYYRCVEDYFEELERVHEERYQSPKKAKSYPCPAQVPVLAIEAWGYVPLVGKGHDLALNIAFWLEGSVDSLMRKPVYLTNVEEYPPEKLKQIRPYNFLFRKHSFGDGYEYFANACAHCKAPTDDFLLFYEQDGVFARCNPAPDRSGVTLQYDLPMISEAQFA